MFSALQQCHCIERENTDVPDGLPVFLVYIFKLPEVLQ